MKYLVLVAVLAARSLSLTAVSPAGSASDKLPDLVPIEKYLKDNRIQRSGGLKFLRFSAGAGNFGEGALEVRGERASTGDPMTAIQRVYQSGGFTDVTIGTFVYTGSHGHWHFNAFARYELLYPDGSLAASTDKASFCLLDVARIKPRPPGSPRRPVYTSCNQGDINALQIGPQGVAVGWADVYKKYIEGQLLEITGLPKGQYTLRVTVDPENHILESDEGNNVASVQVRIR